MRCYYHLCFCQEAPLSLKDQDIERGNKKKEMNVIQKTIHGSKWIKNWKKNVGVRQGVKNSKPFIWSKLMSERSFPTKSFFNRFFNSQIEKWIFFCYFQCFPKISELLQKNRNRNLQFFSIKKQFEEIIWVSNWKRMQSRARV